MGERYLEGFDEPVSGISAKTWRNVAISLFAMAISFFVATSVLGVGKKPNHKERDDSQTELIGGCSTRDQKIIVENGKIVCAPLADTKEGREWRAVMNGQQQKGGAQ